MNVQRWLQRKNSRNVAAWAWRWHLQGGSRFWVARDLQDLRNENDREQWRRLESALRHTPKSRKRRVVNIAAWRMDRALRNQSNVRRQHVSSY